MQLRAIETRQGPVWLKSAFDTHDPTHPLVLAIGGAFPGEHDLEWLRVEGADLVLANLPGFHSPFLQTSTVDAFITAFSEATQTAFADREVIGLGISTGALVVTGLRVPQLKAAVLVEPFFSTAKLWPLIELTRLYFPQLDERHRQWCWTVLGISANDVADRRYGHLVQPGPPTRVICGDIPLFPRRPVRGLPSLTDDDDRGLLRRAGAQLTSVPGGHNVPQDAPEILVQTIQGLLAT